jgi:hypothetical protein
MMVDGWILAIGDSYLKQFALKISFGPRNHPPDGLGGQKGSFAFLGYKT